MTLPERSLPLRILHHPSTRLVLTLLVLLGALLLLAILASGVTMPMGELGKRLLSDAMKATAALVALLCVGRYLERRGPTQLGLGPRGSVRQLAWGALLGAGLLGVVIAVLALAGWYQVLDSPPAPRQHPSREWLMWLAIFIAAGFYEELLFRGIIFRLVEEWLGSAAALAVSGACFGWVHMDNDHGTGLIAAAIAVEGGLLLGGSYMLTRTLWFPTGVHVAWNVAQGVLVGVPVSGIEVESVLEGRLTGPEAWTGGGFGVEGGIVSIVLSSLVGIALVTAAARRGQWQPFLPRRRVRSQPYPPTD